MAKTFRIDLLGSAVHDDKTLDAYSRIDRWKRSGFIRYAIMEYAKKSGYPVKTKKVFHCPIFLNERQWETFKDYNSKSKLVDYSYFLAFHWLKYQSKFKYIKSGELLREIVGSSINLIPDFLASLEVETVA